MDRSCFRNKVFYWLISSTRDDGRNLWRRWFQRNSRIMWNWGHTSSCISLYNYMFRAIIRLQHNLRAEMFTSAIISKGIGHSNSNQHITPHKYICRVMTWWPGRWAETRSHITKFKVSCVDCIPCFIFYLIVDTNGDVSDNETKELTNFPRNVLCCGVRNWIVQACSWWN
jgi:hypothetical protein